MSWQILGHNSTYWPHRQLTREFYHNVQAGSLGAQLQAHSLKGPSPLTLQLPTSNRVPLEGAELVAYQEQKRKEEMGAVQRPAPQSSDAKLAEPLPTRWVALTIIIIATLSSS